LESQLKQKAYEEESPIANEFRRIVFKLYRLLPEKTGKSILVTSPMRMEGKTTASCHLAVACARESKNRVLLLDGDLRRPRVHTELQLRRRPGLRQHLAGEISVEEAVQTLDGFPNLSILTSGGPSRQPSQYIRGGRISELLDVLKQTYDVIILDSPPLIPVSDPLTLAGIVDGLVLVVMAGKTPRQVLKRAMTLLGDFRSRLLGVVVNNYERRLPYYYDYRYYGQRYGEGAVDANNEDTKRGEG
jgi:capsular exopolysaccharide synthesis family protein